MKKIRKISDIRGKRVLFIATKNADYLRVTQEKRILEELGNTVTVIASKDKSYIKRLLYVYKSLLRVNMDDYDLSFVTFAPQLIMPLFGRKLSRKPVVVDFFISCYDTLCCDRKKFSPTGIIGRLIKHIDRITLRRADLAVCDTKAHGRYFCREFGYPEKQMRALYLEADTSIYYPREMPENPVFTVLYFGSVLPLQGVDVILDAIKRLSDRDDIRFVLIGNLGRNDIPKDSPITEYIEWLSQEELAERIAGADLCLAGHFCDTIMKAKRTIPGKAYIYRAMGKPMILGDNPATRELYSETDEGIYFVEMGSGEKLAERILEIKEQIG